MKHASIVRLCLLVVLTGLFFTGILCLLTTQLPYDWVKFQLDALSVDGDADRFTISIFHSIINKLYVVGFFAVCLTVIGYVFRNPITKIAIKNTERLTRDGKRLHQDCLKNIQSIVKNTDRFHLLVLLLILFVGLGARLYFLFQPIRHDEAFTFTNYASKPLILGLSNYSFPNNHLFHTFCVHISYLIFGNQLWAIRLPAFLAGILTLPLMYLLGRKLYNKETGLITTAFLAVSSALIEYGTNARGYALIGFIFIALLLLANYLNQKDNQTAWTLLALISAIGFHTVPVMLYPFATVWLWLLLTRMKKDGYPSLRKIGLRLITYGALTVFVTGILYLPVLVASGVDALIHNRFVQPMALPAFLMRLPERLSDVWLQWSRDYQMALKIGLTVMLGIGVIGHRKIANYRLCLVIPACLSLAIILPIQGVLPPERVWLYLLPVFLLVASAGLVSLINHIIPTQSRAAFASVFALGLSTWAAFGAYQSLTHYYPFGPGTLKDAEAITEDLKSQFQTRDRLLTIATAAPLEYYFQKHRVPIDYLREDINKSNRLIVLVLEDKYTLDQVLKMAKISDQDFTSPQLLRNYPSARLYEMKRNITVQNTTTQRTGSIHDNRN